MATILIVDPSIWDRKRMRGVLEAAGHEVLEAEHPADAQRLMAAPQAAAVGLVVTELLFPDGTSGIPFIEWLKADVAYTRIPALVVALQPAREDVIRLVQAGGRMLVTKPFGPDMLLRRVTETLKEQDALRQGEDERLTWQIDSFIRREIKRAGRTGAPLAVIVGRIEGSDPAPLVDELMRAFLPKLRESDVIARLGERELFLFLPDTDPTGAANVAERLQTESIAVGELLQRRLLLVVGTASFPADVANASALLALAQRRARAIQGA
ncbi:MAG TPA: response regulator [Symbiobacteriaceae bacterium]|nr:response regulator [Symbiobacteriaceae bacterium]